MMPWKQTDKDKLDQEIQQKITKVEMEGIDFMNRFATTVPRPTLAMRACPYFIVCGRDQCTFYKPRLTYVDKVVCSWPVDSSGMAGIGVSDTGEKGAITIKSEYLQYVAMDPGVNVVELFEVKENDEDKSDLRE